MRSNVLSTMQANPNEAAKAEALLSIEQTKVRLKRHECMQRM